MDQQPRLPLWFLFANWAMVLVALGIGWFLGSRRFAEMPEPQRTAFDLIYRQILEAHVDPPSGQELLDRALAAMAKVDPYSLYIGPKDLARHEERSTGTYEGIGIVVVRHGDDMVVHYPLAGGPAERAGILPGDRLVGVDDKDIRTMPAESRQNAVSELVRGPARTTVRLRIARDDGEHEIAVERADVRQSSVRWAHVEDAAQGLGYLHLAHFPKGACDDVRGAIDAMQAKVPLRGLLIDLRGNPGGSLDECVAIANLFLRSGTILSQRRRDLVVESFSAKAEACAFPDLPLAVLVDADSASASEVLAGALQDHHRAVVVGVRTYGKGYINTEYAWRDLPFRLKLTTAHFYTPSGRNIDRHQQPAGDGEREDKGGITPDVQADVDAPARRRLAVNLQTQQAPERHRAAFAAVAAKYGFPVPEGPSAAADALVAKAVDALRERVAAGEAAQALPKDR